MNDQTPKSRARKIIKNWMANDRATATIENDLFQEIANEISDAIEECAQLAEFYDNPTGQAIAADIRARK